ncbi:repeatmulti-domain protein [Pyrenophora tritici-repentis]|nr:repeatmulti-domain protein [Pyrenophora tritici-repentis]
MHDFGDDLSEIKDARLRKYIAEERRISRIPAFDADDCGDGEYFPSIPIATYPIEAPNPFSTSATPSLSSLGLTTIPYTNWLTIPPYYTTQHAARTHLLSTSRSACIQALPDADAACRELMLEVCDFLVEHYPQQFLFQKRSGRRWIRNESTGENFLLEAPWRVSPGEVVSRLTGVDWCVWGRSESTRMWYLQASATCFPAGYDIPLYIGKSVDAIIYGEKDKGPMVSWSALPDLLLHSHLIPTLSTSPQAGPSTFPSLTSHIIQTSPPTHSLASTLHITRPIDFFAGNIANLHPSELLVRTSTQVFARLPKSGAVI